MIPFSTLPWIVKVGELNNNIYKLFIQVQVCFQKIYTHNKVEHLNIFFQKNRTSQLSCFSTVISSYCKANELGIYKIKQSILKSRNHKFHYEYNVIYLRVLAVHQQKIKETHKKTTQPFLANVMRTQKSSEIFTYTFVISTIPIDENLIYKDVIDL